VKYGVIEQMREDYAVPPMCRPYIPHVEDTIWREFRR